MKNIILLLMAALCVMSCKKNDQGEEQKPPVGEFSVTTLVLTVGGSDYAAVAVTNADPDFNGALSFTVPEAGATATVKTLALSDAETTANIKVGDVLTFTDDKYTIVLTKSETQRKYLLRMLYEEDPGPEPDASFVYFAWKNPEEHPHSQSVTEGINPRLVSVNEEGKYEGYVDMTGKGWFNIGIVSSDLTKYYDYRHDAALPNTSYFTVIMAEKEGVNGEYNFEGPWAGWDGMCKIDFDAATKEFTLLKTVWTIEGSATGGTAVSMTYNGDGLKWSVEDAVLSEGAFKFKTVPVSGVSVTYGDKGDGKPGAEGADIPVSQSGTYSIVLDLSTSPDYTYTIVRTGDVPDSPDPEPDADCMYFLTYYWPYNAVLPETAKIHEITEDGGVYEGHVYIADQLGNEGAIPMALVSSDKSTLYTFPFWHVIPENGYSSVDFTKEDYNGSTLPGACGPSADWGASNGVWMLRFDVVSLHAFILQTCWHITGTATGGEMKAMTYSVADNKWSITAELAAGNFKFQTQDAAPYSEGGMKNVIYGRKEGATLSEDGSDITVESAGNYTIVMDLSRSYTYSITKN